MLSLIVVGVVALNPGLSPFSTAEDFRYFILFSNSAHFASSTVRLYTKPGVDGHQSFPFVKIVLPLLALAVVTLCMFRTDTLGSNLRSLYFTWSPYHYAAQTYGLTVMYCYRSGCLLNASNKRLLWWVAMLPFIYNFTLFPTAGLHWLDYAGWLNDPVVNQYLETRKVTIEELRTYIQEKSKSANAIFFGIFWKENAQHIGNVKLEPIDRKKKETT